MRKLKKPVSVLLSLIMVFSLLTIIPVSADAAEAVEYIYRWWDAETNEVKQETRICSGYTDIRERSSDDFAPGWYYASCPTALENGERLFVRSGTVNIIVKDGIMLEIDNGIGVEPGATLNIFGQADDSGYLVADTDDPNNAVYGGTIENGNDDDPNAGDINIYGGKVQTGYGDSTFKGAAIGGAKEGAAHRITIYGGDHHFRRQGSGAGIGGGDHGWVSCYTDEGVTGEGVRIYGGTVEAVSATGAGIGNGYRVDGSPCSIAVYGGNITAMATGGGAGIGGGRIGGCAHIHIYDGNVTAIGYNPDGESGAGIGSGAEAILLGFADNSINIHGGKVVALGTSGAGIGSGYNRKSGPINITGGSVFASSTAGGAGIGSGYNGKSDVINIQNAVVLATTAGENIDADGFEAMFNSMLSDAGTMMGHYETIGPNGPNSTGGLLISGLMSIIKGLGPIFTTMGERDCGAAIGGGDKGSSGQINIQNSIVIARAGKMAAGIGCGKAYSYSFLSLVGTTKYDNIKISGSLVDSQGGKFGAGIGGGDHTGPDKNAKITITESVVNAVGGKEAAGIGSGNEYEKYGTIEIDSAIIEAHGGDYGAAIGGGDGGGKGSVTIKNESDVKAYAGEDGAAIGGGEGGSGGSITIEDSTVYAEGNYFGAGIGGGEDGGVDTVTIRGGSSVTAVGGSSGNTIGIGHGAYNAFAAFFTGNYPSGGKLYFPETSFVRIGEDKDHTRVVPASYIYENGRGKETRYISIYSCPHENTEICVEDSQNHVWKCTHCREITRREAHIWDSGNICSVCGATAEMVTLTFKEQNNDGEVTRTVSVPKFTEYEFSAPENIPDGQELVCWITSANDPHYLGDKAAVRTNETYTAVYAPVVETTYIDKDGFLQTVTARKFQFKEYDCGDLYSGWYIIDEDIPDDFGGVAMLYGDVKLILADDVTVSSKYFSFQKSSLINSTLTLYGQTKQTGTISPALETSLGTFNDFVQYGGNILNSDGLNAENVKIAGGVFEARRLEVTNRIELGWSRWSDHIRVVYYRYNNSDPEIFVTEGKRLLNSYNNSTLSGVLDDNQKRSIESSLLIPDVDYKFDPVPTWSWSEDHTEATATFSNASGVKAEVRANVVHTVDGLYINSTASVNFKGELYSDTVQAQFRWYVINQTNATSGHGTVEISADMAEPGELVEITADPDPGYFVKSVAVTPLLSNTDVMVLGGGNAFIMPKCSVNVEVIFEQQNPNPITINTIGSGTVTANVSEAREGDEITLTITPETDNGLKSISGYDMRTVSLTALDGGYNNEGEEPEKLIDGDKNTKWGVGTGEHAEHKIVMKADRKIRLGGYSLTTGNDNETYHGRNWKSWTIYGANFLSDSDAVMDSPEWQVVTTVTDDTVLQDVNNKTYDYELEEPGEAYRYYMIEITQSQGSAYIQMSEFEMKDADKELVITGEGNARTFTMPAYPVVIEAEFESLPYRVITWLNDDSSVIDTTDVELNTVPTHDDPIKAEDTYYTYTFAGWNDGETTYAPDALPAVTKHITYTAVFDAVRKPYFSGHSLSLNGDVGVNFYLNLTDQEIADGATVDFVRTVNGVDKTHSVTLTADDKYACGYKASCPIAVAEMTYEITATLTINNETIATDTYSAKQYGDRILTDGFRTAYLENHTELDYEKLSALVKTMLDYGAKAQIQFNRNIRNLANKGVDYRMEDVDAYMITTMPSNMDAGLDAYGLSYAGSTIVYLSKTSLRHYYTITDQDKFDAVKDSITFNGEKVEYKTKDGMIYFERPDIAAADLDTAYTLTIGESSYDYCVLDYVKECLNAESVPYNTMQLVSATYWYNLAANIYFGR